jgi:predicted nucleic acid-binding protein
MAPECGAFVLSRVFPCGRTDYFVLASSNTPFQMPIRVLLDTNILIHREATTIVKEDIGVLFRWLDQLHYDRCIHPCSVAEIQKHKDPKVVLAFEAKLQSYLLLKTEAPESHQIQAIRANDKTENDKNDTTLVKELQGGRVDFIISEDRGIHRKATLLGIAHRVFTIDDFLEKVTAENPKLTEYKVLSVRQFYFGNLKIDDAFFDSFKRDYQGFEAWFNRKSDEIAYVCKTDSDALLAFLYLKTESETEPYPDIAPAFAPKRRLKIGTFKVALNGYKLGERFLKIIFDNAVLFRVDEIYVTIFERDEEQRRLILLLQDWGFKQWGMKRSTSGEELVLVRDFKPQASLTSPRHTFPYISRKARKFIVPIYPAYHTELLPDSILRTERPEDFVDNAPNRNALRKVYISRSYTRDMKKGDIVIFYRTAQAGTAAHHSSVATTLGIIEGVLDKIGSFDEFIRLCRKRSVFSDDQLKNHWDYNKSSRPFVVNFLYTYSLPKRPNLATLKENNIISEAPRGFEQISDAAFNQLLEISHAEKCLIVD